MGIFSIKVNFTKVATIQLFPKLFSIKSNRWLPSVDTRNEQKSQPCRFWGWWSVLVVAWVLLAKPKPELRKTAISTAGFITAVIVRSELLNAPTHQLEKKICYPSFRHYLASMQWAKKCLLLWTNWARRASRNRWQCFFTGWFANANRKTNQ